MSIDIDAWVRAWRGPLIGWFVRRGASLADADERTAEVFVRAWGARSRFRKDPSDERAVGPWLMGIARNVAREAARRPKSVSLEDPDRIPADGEGQDTQKDRDCHRLLAAIQRLPPVERALIAAFYFENTSTTRVARLFSLTPRAVEGRLRRARERLRGWLDEGSADSRETHRQSV